MSLPTPEYDGRTRDEVVAGTVAAVRRKVGTWTGQDRTDPGRGLIETCTDMVMALRDRLNLAPDQRRLQMLRLLGVRPYRPAPAQTEVVLQLAAPSPEPVVVPAGQEVATRPVGEAEPVVFSTLTEAVLNPCVLVAAGDFAEFRKADGALEGTLTEFGSASGRTVEPGGPAFAGPAFHLNLPYLGDFPPPGDAFANTGPVSTGSGDSAFSSYALVVLSVPVPSTRVTLDVSLGVDPPPEVGTGVTRGHWEAWQGTHWTGCRVVTDTVTAQGRPGKVTLDLPPAHAPAQLLLHRAAGEGGSDSVQRLRDVGLIRYHADAGRSPLTRVALDPVLAVSVPVVQAGLVRNETLGTATGTPGERLRFTHPPLPRSTDPLVVEAVLGGRTAQWTYVASLAGSGPDDRHFTLDPRTGEAVFAPVVAGARGPRQHGAPLPAGAVVRIRRYLTGGGARGNVPARTVTVLRTPLPYVSSVTNPAPAVGGTERESAAACATRLPLGAPVPERAVVPVDYEQLALAASAGMARIHHVRDAPDDALDPARNYLPWRPARTDVAFTLAPGTLTLPAGIQVTTEDGETVFTTTKEATRVPPDAMGAARLGLVPGVTSAVGMFEAGDYQAGGEFSGPFKEGGGLVLALVEIKEPHDPGRLTLWVTAGEHREPEDYIAVSVFAPRKAAPWWDTAAPLAYASTPAQEITLADGTTVSAHPVHVSKSARWQAAVARGDLARTAKDAVDSHDHDFPTEEAAWWIAVQILDPKGTPTTPYTVYADSGTTDKVPAEQYEEHDRAREPFSSTDKPGQVYPLLYSPVYVPENKELPKVCVGDESWRTVTSFHDSLADSKDVVINASTGQVHFGPEVTGPSGTRQYGAIPLPENTPITVDGPYKTTLGSAGNDIPAGRISRLKTPDDRIVGVRNVSTSRDGKNGYTDTSGGSTQAGVTLMVVPFVTADERGWFPFHMLTPTRDACDTLRRSLRACQPEGVPVWLKQPVYHGIRVDARIVPADYRTADERAELRAAAERALYRYFSPVGGGPDGTGWPLGRPVYAGEAFRVLEQVPGVGRVATAELVPVDPLDGSASDPVVRIRCGPGETVYSVEHRVTVAEVPS
ncbi:putative phage baseplate assembly protein [Streptomyces olivoverticillatus]|uniref:Putative phage baseplate assembly protein n=1 Tax=Streptomyces olivoverticillatus TaxID=66427 RepID=A0A7W7LTP1_9ACTN|nr:putative baseplate assembly protein [Streptomyces olivoverticillatus]MBB4895882.1 putative phage baseplate assembly protein [Streptomyces olivoverticillatus]